MPMPPRGFSIVELVAALVVMSALLVAGIPAMAILRERADTLNAFHTLTTSLMSARMAAISRRMAVTVCPSADGRYCRDDLVWEQGWIVYYDPDREKQPSDAGAVLWHEPERTGRLAIRSTAGRHRVRYQPTGLSGGNNLTLRVCSHRGPHHLGDVVVNLAGRARTQPGKAPDSPCPYVP
ncbi:GspH/FimT family pseudopilin [Arenimonas daejeonensis]|uniref:GspH/FimT family pseudopilin n=1 Tax=Arenimonas daejeonensis TaxID=370777 RepID=UPI0011BEDF5A